MLRLLKILFSAWDVFNVFMHLTHPAPDTDYDNQYATNQQTVQEEWKAKADAMDDTNRSQDQQTKREK